MQSASHSATGRPAGMTMSESRFLRHGGGGLNDCMSGLQHCFDNKEALGISTIVVSGESGGGNLCAALAIKAKREGKDPIEFLYVSAWSYTPQQTCAAFT